MNKYFIYCRKSSEQEDRQILSLDSQEKELTELAQKDGLKIVGIYRESGSAHVIGRKYFNEMLTRIENGEANGLIVWDESRIARNSFDGGRVVYMIDLNQIVEIRKPGKVYANTPDDKSWLSMIFVMSKKESDDKGVNVKRGLKTKAEKGWLPSGAKPGYMNDPVAKKGNKTVQNDPIRFPLIKKCWELMLTGAYTVPMILRLLNKEWGYRSSIRGKVGGKPMCRSQLYRVFTDPYYYGTFEFPEGSGNWYKGGYEPMVTKEEFDMVQALLGRKGNPRLRTKEFAFTGLISCGECGALITAEEKWQIICPVCKLKFNSMNKDCCPGCKVKIEEMVNKTMLHYIYYHCTKAKNPHCPQGSIRLDRLENQIMELLSRIGISEDFKNWAIKHLNELNDKKTESRNATIFSLNEAYDNCIKRIDNLRDLMISPANSDKSLLSDEEFKAQKVSLLADKASLEEKRAKIGQGINEWLETAERAFNLAVYARHWFENGDLYKKREILVAIGSNLILKDRLLCLDLKKPYYYLKDMATDVPETCVTLEPEERIVRLPQMEYLWAQNPLVLSLFY